MNDDIPKPLNNQFAALYISFWGACAYGLGGIAGGNWALVVPGMVLADEIWALVTASLISSLVSPLPSKNCIFFSSVAVEDCIFGSVKKLTKDKGKLQYPHCQ